MNLTTTRSANVRRHLSHPIIDGDGHTLEFTPALLPYIKRLGGEDIALAIEAMFKWMASAPSLKERRERHVPYVFWLNSVANARDRATMHLPKLLYERLLPELGIDFMVVYPSLSLSFPALPEPAIRRICCRAINEFHADAFREYADRLAPALVVPMHTPEEAIEELEYG